MFQLGLQQMERKSWVRIDGIILIQYVHSDIAIIERQMTFALYGLNMLLAYDVNVGDSLI